jgi:hypothetical protein
MKLLFADMDDVLAIEHIEQLVFTFVNVQRCVDHGRYFLEEGEGAAGRLGRGPDENRGVSEDEPLAGIGVECVGRQPLHRRRG